MIIFDGLPNELIAIVLQCYLPDDDILTEFPSINKVLNGNYRKSIIDAHTIEEKKNNYIKYLFKGELHKEDGPAEIQYYENGDIKYQTWFINGEPHNSYGPANIEYYKNGNIKDQLWFINGKPHNSYGPAYIEYYDNGNIKYQSWYINGKLHNSDGPAIIQYCEDGKKNIWYVNGIQLTEEEFNTQKQL